MNVERKCAAGIAGWLRPAAVLTGFEAQKDAAVVFMGEC
jgi:hypothetical protein